MDANKLKLKIFSGYNKAAKRIGYISDIYRPQNTLDNPISDNNKIYSLNASFNAENMKYTKPNKYGHPTWYCLVDATNLLVGDYIKNNQDGIFFIAGMQQALPILVVSCNAIISVYRPTDNSQKGNIGYRGNTASTEVLRINQFPASLLAQGAGKNNNLLPMDTGVPQFSVLLPNIKNNNVIQDIKVSDIIKDNIDRRFIVQSAELTDLGWRLIVQQAVA